MEKAFLFVVALGVAIGLLWPSSHRVATTASPPAAAKTIGPAVAAAADPEPPMVAETRLQRMPSGHFYADGNINGQPVRLVVDTGANMVALTVADAQRIGVPFSPAAFNVIGSSASGAMRGQDVMLDRVEVGGKEVRDVRAAVVEGLDVSLLGQTYLSRISSVQMSGDTMTLK